MIILTETKQEKNPNTKTTYIQVETKKEVLTEQQYKNTVCDDTLKWFRRLGGTETAERSYTSAGYNVTKLTSTSPDRQHKSIREFQFIDFNTYQQRELFKNLFQSMDTNGLFKLKRFKRLLTLAEVKQILINKTK